MATGISDVCPPPTVLMERDGWFFKKMSRSTALTLKHASPWVVNFCKLTGEALRKRTVGNRVKMEGNYPGMHKKEDPLWTQRPWAVSRPKTQFLSTHLQNKMHLFISWNCNNSPLPPGKDVFLEKFKIKKMHLLLFTSGELEFRRKKRLKIHGVIDFSCCRILR